MNPVEIETLRKAFRMTQVELAQKLGVSPITVNRWEQGHRRPSKLAIRELERLRRGLTGEVVSQ